jgi:predicted RNA polymerase sigma factor
VQDRVLRKDLCWEAMRLVFLLIENPATNLPPVNALFSLMSFHASRFDARTDAEGEQVLYDDQDTGLWDEELVKQGAYFLNRASTGTVVSKYHIEANIAYWHTIREDTAERWENILQLYNHLLIIEYSPMAALNRTYAVSKVHGKQTAIAEAEKLDLRKHHLYYALLGNLYAGIDPNKAIWHTEQALQLAKSAGDKKVLEKQLEKCKRLSAGI